MTARPQPERPPLPPATDAAILALVRALARQAAREDHAAEQARINAGDRRQD
jgi:hypothetical protein